MLPPPLKTTPNSSQDMLPPPLKTTPNSSQNMPYIHTRHLTDEQLKKIISGYDHNHDGGLDKSELEELFGSLDVWFVSASSVLDDLRKYRDKIKEPAKYAVKLGNKLNNGAVLRRGKLKDLRLTEKAFEYLSLYIPGYKARCGLSYVDVNGDGNDKEEELGNIIKCALKFGYRFKDSDFIVRGLKFEEKLTEEKSLPYLGRHQFADGDRDNYITEEDLDRLVYYIRNKTRKRIMMHGVFRNPLPKSSGPALTRTQ